MAVALGASAAAAPNLVRDRVRATALRACAERTSLRCELGAISLAADGILLHSLTLRDANATNALQVRRVGVRWNWLRLVLRRTQGISLRIGEVDLRARGDLTTLRGFLKEPPAGDASPRARRVRLDRVVVERIQTNLDLAASGRAPLRWRMDGANARWERGGPTLVTWPDGTLALRNVNAHSGRCEARIDRWRRTLECAAFGADADTATLVDAAHDLEAMLREASPTGAAPPAPAEDPDATGEERPRTSLRLRDGGVRLARARSELVNLHPTHVEITLVGGRVEEARVDVGARDDRAASLSALLHRPGDAPWRLALNAVDLPLRRLAPWVPVVPWHGTDRGTLRAQVRLSPGDRAGRFVVDGDLAVQDFGLQHPGLAREPVDGLSASLEGQVTVDLPGHRVSSPGIHAAVNGIRFTLAGSLERAPGYTAIDASLQVPQIDCDSPRTALPPAVVGPLRGFSFAGTLAADARVRLDTRRLSDTLLDFHVDDHCLVSQAGFEADLRRFSRPFVQRAQEPGGVVRAFITGPGSPAWVPLPSISPFVLAAVVTREDGGFYRHHGFSPDEVRGALVRNIALGRFAFGASTLSMQLVKNVFLAREKTLVRKLQEVALTWWLERSLDKNAILELYLNVVEFGPGIYGIGPASRFFFGVEPHALTILQAAYLATLLPAPVPRFAYFQRGSVPLETLGRLRAIARSMVGARLVDPVEGARAREEGLAFRPLNTPVPGAVTWTVDPTTTDEAAQALVDRAAVRVNNGPVEVPDAPAPTAAPEDEARDDGPRE
ncbi:MAG: transglycosylase domain-containing protein [Polyangiales bacterium]